MFDWIKQKYKSARQDAARKQASALTGYERQARVAAIVERLTAHARAAMGSEHPGWKMQGARGYGEALTFCVPEIVRQTIGDDGPGLLRDAWRASDDLVNDLAGFISFRYALLSFADFSDDDETHRQMLMDIAGTLFPPSDRCSAFIERWWSLMREPSQLRGKMLGISPERTDDGLRATEVDPLIIAEILSLFTLDTVRDLMDAHALDVTELMEYRIAESAATIERVKAYRELTKSLIP